MKIRSYGVFFAFLLVSLAFTGCGSKDSVSFVGVSVNQEAMAAVKLNVLTDDAGANVKASVANQAPTATCIMKVIRPENPKLFDEIRRTVEVVEGTANFEFQSIPARSTIVKVIINGGKIGNYSELVGAQDLVAGENLVDVAGLGSNLEPDIIVSTIESLVTKDYITSNVENSIVSNVKSAYITTKNVAGTELPNMVENVSQVYLSKIANEVPKQSDINNYVNQFAITTSLISKASGQSSLRADIRGATNPWTWDYTRQFWYTYTPGYYSDEAMLWTYCFKDSNNNHYSTLNASPYINTINIGSLIAYRTVLGLYQFIETYDFKVLTATTFEVTGLFEASLADTKFLVGIPYKITFDTTYPYPTSGELGFALIGVGSFFVKFNGTCVADVAYEEADGTYIYSKVIIAPSFINNGVISEIGSIRGAISSDATPINYAAEAAKDKLFNAINSASSKKVSHKKR